MIREPLGTPPPGILFATRVLVQNIERQADPDYSAAAAHQLIEQEVVVMRRQSATEPAQWVASSMHRRIDKHMRKRDEGDPKGTADVKCRRGCTACCYQHVTLSEPEAEAAFRLANIVEHRIDVERLRKQAAHDVDTFQTALSHADRRCVMLKDNGDCAVYEDRPSACRTYRVVSPPADCDTVANPSGRVLALSTPHAEVVVTASMRVFRHGSFASFLLEAVERDYA